MIKLSIVVPSLGLTESILKLFNSICAQQIVKTEYEIIFVFNGRAAVNKNTKLLKQLCEESALYVSTIYINEVGVNKARNLGLNYARGKIILFLDDDCILNDPSFLTKHILFHEKNEQIFAFGGGYELTSNSNFFDKAYNYMQMQWLYSGIEKSFLRYHYTEHLIGGNFSIKEKFIKNKKSPFNEIIKYGGSEYDFFIKAKQQGLVLVLNNLDVIHATNESIISMSKKLFKQGLGQALINSNYANSIKNKKTLSNPKNKKILLTAALLYFNYVFWWGYFHQQKKMFLFLLHVGRDIYNYLNLIRYKLLNLINKKIEKNSSCD